MLILQFVVAELAGNLAKGGGNISLALVSKLRFFEY